MLQTTEIHAETCRLRIIHGDCIAGMAEMPPGCVDVIVTSPPYNIGVDYRNYDDKIPRDEYLAWTGQWTEAAKRVLAADGSFFLNIGSKPSDPWIAFDVAQVMRHHFVMQNVIHWVKSVAIDSGSRMADGESLEAHPTLDFPRSTPHAPRSTVKGHYKPINSPRYLNQAHEYVFHFTKTGNVHLDRLAIGVPYQDKSNVTRWKAPRLRALESGIRNSELANPNSESRTPNPDLHCRGNVWFIPYETIQQRDRDRPHPATFPPRLAEMCILLHGRGSEFGIGNSEFGMDGGGPELRTPKPESRILVLDPFMGIGSTAVACARLGVDFVGFEVDESYIEAAMERLRPFGAMTNDKMTE